MSVDCFFGGVILGAGHMRQVDLRLAGRPKLLQFPCPIMPPTHPKTIPATNRIKPQKTPHLPIISPNSRKATSNSSPHLPPSLPPALALGEEAMVADAALDRCGWDPSKAFLAARHLAVAAKSTRKLAMTAAPQLEGWISVGAARAEGLCRGRGQWGDQSIECCEA